MNEFKKELNIDQVNLEISKIQNPLTFLFLLLTTVDKINDHDLSIILRLYLKHHYNIALTCNLKKIFINELINHNKSWSVLINFYKLLQKKISLVLSIKKVHLIYENDKFWKLTIDKQLDYLYQIKEQFLSVFDCSKGGVPYFLKLIAIFKTDKYNREEIYNDVRNRLIILLKILPVKLFETLDIPLIHINDFYQLTNEGLVKYLIIIYEKFIELLNYIIKLFDAYNIICIKLNNLLDPVIININSNIIDSEIETNDITFFCNL